MPPASREDTTCLDAERSPTVQRPSPWLLLRVFLILGTQSFGGGPALLFLMRRAMVEHHGWLSDEDFTHAYAISQITPGINLIALTVLLGWRLAGAAGAVLSLVGLLLPSVTITIVLTAFYTSVRDLELVQATLRGIVPATIGLTLLLGLAMGRQLLQQGWTEGRASFLFGCGLILASGLLAGVAQVSVIAIFALGGLVGALYYWRFPPLPDEKKTEP